MRAATRQLAHLPQLTALAVHFTHCVLSLFTALAVCPRCSLHSLCAIPSGHFVARGQVLTAEDTVCVPTPLYHCFGMVLGSLACTASGAGIVLPSATFDPRRTLQAIQAERCSALYGVPVPLAVLVSHLLCLCLPLSQCLTCCACDCCNNLDNSEWHTLKALVSVRCPYYVHRRTGTGRLCFVRFDVAEDWYNGWKHLSRRHNGASDI